MTGRIVLVSSDSKSFSVELRAALPNLSIEIYENELEAGSALDEAQVLLTMGRWMTPEILSRMKQLRWLACTITGTDHLDPLLAGREDIILTNARGIHGPQMTETILLHMLTLSRGGINYVRNKDKHAWQKQDAQVLRHRTAVVVGLGSIAEYCARILKCLGMSVMGVTSSPRHLPGFDKVWPRAQIIEAASLADYLIVLAPYTARNHGMIDAGVLRAMKRTAYIINVSRGGVLDETALTEALYEGRIAGAGLDVFETQPLPPSSPLWELENVFITPQIGGMSDQYAIEAVRTCLAPNLKAWLAGRPQDIINIVQH